MNKVATEIECRLMCASSCAYGINPACGKFHKDQVQKFYDGIGFIADPVAISRGADFIDAALVGQNSADGIIVAFRGTIPPISGVPVSQQLPALLDWIQDIFFSKPEAVVGLPGKVHTGFYDAVTDLWHGIEQAVSDLQNSTKSIPVFFTGHSKGGPLASIAAMKARGVAGLCPAKVYTFASARPGDTGFASGYDAAFEQISYENYLDLVPFLPPSESIVELFAAIPLIGKLFKEAEGWDYAPVGKRLYIQKDGDVVDDSNFRDDIRGLEIVTKLLEEKIGIIAAAHCHGCKTTATNCAGGYMQGACHSQICGP